MRRLPERPVRRLLRPFLGFIDAGISSLGNFTIVWLGAKLLDINDFGALSIAITVGLLAQGVAKSSIVEGYTLGYSARENQEQYRRAQAVIAAVLAAGVLLSVLLFSASVITGQASQPLGILALLIVPLVAQDSVRWICYARHDVSSAILNTAIWTIATGCGVGVLVAIGRFGPTTAVAAWGLSAGTAAAITLLRIQLVPRFSEITRWLLECKAIGLRSLLDYSLTQATGLGGALLVAAIAGATQYGLFRLAQLPLAIIQIAVTGSISVLQPTLVRKVAVGAKSDALKLARRAAVGLSVLSGLVLLGTMLAPNALMVGLLGESWPEAAPILPIMTVGLIASGVAASYGPFLRATGRLRYEVNCKLAVSPIALGGISVGAWLLGGIGGAVGQAASTIVVAVLFVIVARRWNVVRVLPSREPNSI